MTVSEEWLCQQIINGVGDAFIFSDRDGIIRLWSPGAETVFGYPADQAIGQSLDIIVPERLRQRHWDGYQQTIRTGVTRYARDLLAVPAIKSDGQRISIEFTIALVRDSEGTLIGAGTVIRDVTARWSRDKALKERLADLEKQTGSTKTAV
jgi:PAS domain S-box-containing protein